MTFSGQNAALSGAYVVDCDSRTSAIQNLLIDGVDLTNGDTVTLVNNGVATCAFTASPITWTGQAAADTNPWTSVTYGGGRFVAVASSDSVAPDNRVMYSDDGLTWTGTVAAQAIPWTSVTYGLVGTQGRFVAVASSGTNRAMWSNDGVTWTSSGTPTGTLLLPRSWTSVTWGNGVYVAVASDGAANRVATSPDGNTWTARTGSVLNTWSSVTFGRLANGQGRFVAVSTTGNPRAMWSNDGVSWTNSNTFVSALAANTWTSVTWGNGLYVAVASDGGQRVATSPDGDAWTGRTAAAANPWSSVTFGAGYFVAVAITDGAAPDNRVMRSSDGTTWTAGVAAAPYEWTSVVSGNNLFVAVARTGPASSNADRVMISGGVGSFHEGCTPTIQPGGGEIFVSYQGIWYCASDAGNRRRLSRIPYSEAETYLLRALELYPPPSSHPSVDMQA